MPIAFDADRWTKVKETYRQFWGGELERPIIPVVLKGRDPGRPMPQAPLLSQETCHDFSWSAEQLIDRIDYELSCYEFLGDAYPYFNLDCFGPGVVAAMLGGRLDNSSGRVWFWPGEEKPIQDIHLALQPDNRWLQRIKDICAAGMERWQGQVLVGMTDLGGNLDIPATFVTSQQLLLELIDHPDDVIRLTWEAHEAWHQAYAQINAVLQPVNPGYSDWSYIYSDQPSYMLQCDFSYMISPRMFGKFVLPELKATTTRLKRSFYHLDGIGQIGHLDQLLTLPSLNGVQWIHGDGKPDSSHWPEIFQKIHAAGKKIQIISGGFAAVEAVWEQIGRPRVPGIHYQAVYGTLDDKSAMQAHLARFQIA